MTNTPEDGRHVHAPLALQILLWAMYAVVHFLASVPAVQPGDLGMLALMQAVRATTGAALSILAVPLLTRLVARSDRARWAGITGLTVALTFAWMVLDRVTLVALAAAIQREVPWHSLPRGFELEYLLVILVWAAVCITALVNRRNRALRESLLRVQMDAQEARLQTLVSQLNPHFLFNTLNMIRSLIADDPATAREMITRMSALLRRVVALDATKPVPLREEIEYANDYVQIHQVRFGPAMQSTFDVAPSAAPVLVPPLLLQPLLENAMKFGAPIDGVRRIHITAAHVDGRLDIRIRNTGRLGGGEPGAGLRLTRRRLEEFYGEYQMLTVSESNNEVTVSISIEER